MWNPLKAFSDILDGAKERPGEFDDNDYRVAAAALLVHASTIDGEITPVEHAKLQAMLRDRFGLDEAAALSLIDTATSVENEAVDLYRFTSLLTRKLDQAGRERIVEMLWEIVYADGKATELEDNLLWRAADLLGVSSRERIALRQQVIAKTAR